MNPRKPSGFFVAYAMGTLVWVAIVSIIALTVHWQNVGC